MQFRRNVYVFTHPKAKGPKIIKAYSETGAWKKMRAFVMSQMFGDFALTYDPFSVAEVMLEITLERKKEDNDENK
jgi:hypothetical protein